MEDVETADRDEGESVRGEWIPPMSNLMGCPSGDIGESGLLPPEMKAGDVEQFDTPAKTVRKVKFATAL